MRAGFLIDYRRSVAARYAISGARILQHAGATVQIRSTSPLNGSVDRDFDDLVQSHLAMPLATWLNCFDTVIVDTPPAHCLGDLFFGSTRLVRTVLIASSQRIAARQRSELDQYHAIIALSPTIAHRLQFITEARVLWLPPEPGVQLCGSRRTGKRPKVLLVIESDCDLVVSGDAACDLVEDGRFDWTVLRERKRLSKKAWRRLIQCGAKHHDSKKLNRLQRRELIAQHDLMVWPNRHDGAAAQVIEALSVGVPVLTFDVDPQNTYVRHAESGWLVDNEQSMSEASLLRPGLSEVMLDNTLERLREGAVSALDGMQAQVVAGWRNLFEME